MRPKWRAAEQARGKRVARLTTLWLRVFDTADAFVVLRLSRIPGQRPDVVYNGPLALVAAEFGKVQSNGQAHVSLSRLRAIDVQVPHDDRVAARDSRT